MSTVADRESDPAELCCEGDELVPAPDVRPTGGTIGVSVAVICGRLGSGVVVDGWYASGQADVDWAKRGWVGVLR